MYTPVGIVGGGPAGLVLSHLLARAGIDSVVLESRDRAYVERRVRAGVLEQGTVDLLCATGVGERLMRESLVHHGIRLRFEGAEHRIDFRALTGGKAVTVYGQQEVVKDLIRARLEAGGVIEFEAEALGIEGIDGDAPVINYRQGGQLRDLRCDFVAGCDGSHGVCGRAIPADQLTVYEKEYGIGWLGILAQVAPSTEELIYAYSDRGFALHSMRSPKVSRLYLQVRPDEAMDGWPDERIWDELHVRLGIPGWTLKRGPIVERGVTAMRSYIVEPMQHGRLFLAGDAAHIVPPTGAKGMNLAIADVRVLAEGLVEWYVSGRADRLEGYSAVCLRRVWRAEHFSWWMTSMLHRLAGHTAFDRRLQLAQLRYLCGSRAAATTLAENYVGLAEV